MATIDMNYQQIRQLLGVNSLMSFFQSAQNDAHFVDIVTQEQLEYYQDYHDEMESLDKIIECYSRAMVDDSVLLECTKLIEEHE